MSVLKVDRFAVTVAERYILKPFQTLDLQVPGVYTLEGDNLSGKSTVVKMIMGMIPNALEREGPPEIEVNGKAQRVSCIRDAYKLGLSAVFQDDHLIPTMTVREQLLMRHASPDARASGEWLFHLIRDELGERAARMLRRIGVRLSSWEDKEMFLRELEERMRSLLSIYGSQYRDILDLLPGQLSGGGVAVAKLLNAQLNTPLNLLLLDEAFSGVQRSAWPALVESLKEWARRTSATILVVTHNREEVIRWQPRGRLRIEDQGIGTLGVPGYRSAEIGLPALVDSFPVFEVPDEKRQEWFAPFEGPFWVIVDEAVTTLVPTQDLLRTIEAVPGGIRAITRMKASETRKCFEDYTRLVSEGVELFARPEGAIVVIGGGVTLNLGAFVASTLFRGRMPHVLVPTTLMALADVAVGSKTGVNHPLNQGLHRKNVVGTFANPTAVVVDHRFMPSLPAVELKHGLAECLKHGLLQDGDLFEECEYLLLQRDPDVERCIDAAERAMHLKGRVLGYDPWETGYARLLQFGHVHAHAMERVSGLQVPHGAAVLWGVLVEVQLGSKPEIARRILSIVRAAGVLKRMRAISISTRALHGTYSEYLASRPGEAFDGRPLHTLSLDEIGQYSTLKTLKVVPRDVENVMDAIDTLAQALGRDGPALTA